MAQTDIDPTLPTAADTISINKTINEVKEWNVTAIVQDWYSGAKPNYGFLVNGDRNIAADRWRYFASQDNAATSQRPILRITYLMNVSRSVVVDRPTCLSRPPVVSRPAIP